MVPADWAAALSTPLRVVFPDCSRLSRRWLTARDHTETASFCAVVFPLEDRPDRLRPQVSRRARETRTPAKPAKTPRLKCSQPLTAMARAMAAFQPSNVPPRARLRSRRAAG